MQTTDTQPSQKPKVRRRQEWSMPIENFEWEFGTDTTVLNEVRLSLIRELLKPKEQKTND